MTLKEELDEVIIQESQNLLESPMQIASFQNYSMMEPEMYDKRPRLNKTSGGFNFRPGGGNTKQWRNVKPSVYAFDNSKDASTGDRDVNEKEMTNSVETHNFLDSVI